MPFTFEATLKLIAKGKPFTDKSTGEVTPAKFTNYLQGEDSEGNMQVFELKSKSDYSEYINELVVGTIQLYPMREGSGFYATLTDLKPAR